MTNRPPYTLDKNGGLVVDRKALVDSGIMDRQFAAATALYTRNQERGMTDDLIRRLRDALAVGMWDAQRHGDLTAVLDELDNLRAERDAIEAATLERAAQACLLEMVDAEATGEEGDHAYNNACADCSVAIRALKEQTK
jgi:hypothetical protein